MQDLTHTQGPYVGPHAQSGALRGLSRILGLLVGPYKHCVVSLSGTSSALGRKHLGTEKVGPQLGLVHRVDLILKHYGTGTQVKPPALRDHRWDIS
jgi:hypothetical protein